MKRPEGFGPPAQREAVPARSTSSRQEKQRIPREKAVRVRDSGALSVRDERARLAAEGKELKRAARDRRRAERAELRRFTRRSRNRRITLAVALGVVLALVGLVLAAVYSPILSLKQIRVDGASRVSAEEIIAAVDGQLGVPLALLDLNRVRDELGGYRAIRSYVTETLPPDTLVIHIVERQPVASIAVPAGGYQLVDPAGVVLQESTERIPGVPLIDLAGATPESPAFEAAVSVLFSLPPDLLARVDSITARTQDDVSLVLAGVGQRVSWGSADDSTKKARLLGALIAVTDPALIGEFDVSAPTNGVFRLA